MFTRIPRTFLVLTLVIFAALLYPGLTVHAQILPGVKPPATSAAPVQPANPVPAQVNPASANPAPVQPAQGNPAAVQPAAPAAGTTTNAAVVPVGQMFLQSNAHLKVCVIKKGINSGGAGDLDMNGLMTSLGITTSQITGLYLVPANDIVTFEDLSLAMNDSATVSRRNLPAWPDTLTVGSGNYHLILEPAGSPLWYFGTLPIENGGTTTELSATYPDCDLVEPKKPAADASSTTGATTEVKPLPKAGNLAMAIYAPENKKPLASIAVLLLGLGVMGTGSVLGIRRERRLAAATPERFRTPRR